MESNKHDGHGRLTVFLGAAAGSGKTQAMLKAAQERLAEGMDVLVGWVASPLSGEAGALLKGLPAIPPREVDFTGKLFPEVDLDAVLLRRPLIAIIDEMAHANIPGARHAKRYQDIEELLSAGINVYTTLNIQNVESLNDVVDQITGFKEKETVPDSILESAQVHLVDIPSEELMQRFYKGKVRMPEQDTAAFKKVFRPGSLNALRKLALRYTARSVGRQFESYMKIHGIEGPWPAGERVMVCVSPSPFSAQLIRMARRMAEGLQSHWLAVYVETPRSFPASEEDKNSLAKNLRLAEELGAETLNITGGDVAGELLYLARKKNVSQIIIGKPMRSRLWEWMNDSVVDKIIRGSQGISVHVIPGTPRRDRKKSSMRARAPRLPVLSYFLSLVLMFTVTVIAGLLTPVLGLVNVAMILLLPILFSAAKWGTGPTVTSAALGVLTFDFFFVHPAFSFSFPDIRYITSYIIFLLVAFFTGTLSARLQQQVTNARRREARMSALYSLSRDIAAVPELDKVAESIVNKVAETIEGKVVLLLPDKNGQLALAARSLPNGDSFINDGERVVFKWAFDQGKKAGRGTDTLGAAEGLYLPLITDGRVQGVLGVYADSPESCFQQEQLRLLEAFSSLGAMAVIRAQLAEKAKSTEMLAESERLRTALFSSLSHDFRTPLSSIIGAATGLLESDDVYTQQARRELLKNIQLGALRMNRFVTNLLDMARLESGMLQLNKEWCDIQDIIGVALGRMDYSLANRPLKIEIQQDLPLIRADIILIEQVLVNLIDNALKYSMTGTEILISARSKGQEVNISVEDRGQNIPPGDLEKIFDKFYRLKSPRLISGTGLGLAICKGFVEAHKGKIWAENNPAGGTVIIFTLPIEGEIPKKAISGGQGDVYEE